MKTNVMNRDPSIAYETPHRAVPAWVFSLVFHVVLLTAIGWSAQRVQSGVGTETDRPVGIAMVERMPDRDRYSPPEPVAAPSTQANDQTAASSSASAASLAPANMAPPVDLDGILAEMTSGDVPAVQTGELEGAFGSGADAAGEGSKLSLPGKPTTAMLFGVSGSGSRFIYVFDRSDSMNGYGGKPLQAAKTELKRSLQSLSDAQQFQIIFYNETAKPFVPAGSPLQLLTGDASMIRRAQNYVDVVKAFGGTEHYDALRLALRMGPDVIFFLTDARVPRLTSTQFAEVKRLADRSGTSIHAIEFGPEPTSPGDSFLRRLASDNRGEYRYISLDELSHSLPTSTAGSAGLEAP